MTSGPSRPAAPRVVVNPHLDRSRVTAPAGAVVAAFHAALPGYRPTPLHRLDAQARSLGVEGVFVKDESNRLGLPAFKILGASWAVEQIRRISPGTRTLLAASAGNHGRAVARAARQRSLACRIYLPAGTSRTRAELIAAEGAQVVRVDGDYDHAVAIAERAADEPGTALVADTAFRPVEGPPAWVIDGYSTLFRETGAQTPVAFDLLLVPAGVGSVAAAGVRWAVHEHPSAAVVAVEPMAAACIAASLLAGEIVTVPTPGTSMAGLDCATPSAVAWPTLRHGLAGTVAVSDADAHRAMAELATLGLTIGDCGAASLAALRALTGDEACAALRAAVGLDATSNVLCVATEGASDPAAYAQTLADTRT